jgi:hypothetical protein
MLIEKKYGVNLVIHSVGNYLKRWGFTPQKPLRRAYEHQDKAVKIWLEEMYPKTSARTKQEKQKSIEELKLTSDQTTKRARAIALKEILP